MSRIMIRRARAADLDALMQLEEAGFTSDRFSRAQIRHLVTRARGAALLVEVEGTPAGSAFVLWRSGSATARLYSITISEAYRGRGLGGRLLEGSENAARRHGATRMSLEVRPDNEEAIGLYRKAGYQAVEKIPGYYEDGADALRMVKELRRGPA